MSEYSYLWNSLPFEERERLQPYLIEAQIRNLEQAKQKAIKAHKRYLAEMNDWIANCKSVLKKPTTQPTSEQPSEQRSDQKENG